MARGFVVCQYIDDNGTPWRLMVDADYAADSNRGWVPATVPGLYPLPRHWQPRAVIGIAEDGRMVHARCATVDCPLWTGAVTVFTYSGNDGAPYLATRIGTLAEIRRN